MVTEVGGVGVETSFSELRLHIHTQIRTTIRAHPGEGRDILREIERTCGEIIDTWGTPELARQIVEGHGGISWETPTTTQTEIPSADRSDHGHDDRRQDYAAHRTVVSDGIDVNTTDAFFIPTAGSSSDIPKSNQEHGRAAGVHTSALRRRSVVHQDEEECGEAGTHTETDTVEAGGDDAGMSLEVPSVGPQAAVMPENREDSEQRTSGDVSGAGGDQFAQLQNVASVHPSPSSREVDGIFECQSVKLSNSSNAEAHDGVTHDSTQSEQVENIWSNTLRVYPAGRST